MKNKTHQKRVAAIHDISGFGKCSLTVALPILSAAGIETSALPTAILSTHTGGISGYTYRDLTDDMRPIMQHWKSLGIPFDAIYTGYLGSFEQLDIVKEFFDTFRRDGNLILVDPVMGDNGKAYATVTPAFIDRMRQLCRRADLILPNATEAGLLLEKELPAQLDEEGARALADELAASLTPNVVVTGLQLDKYIACAGAGRDRFVVKKLHIARSFPGTGDLYGAVLIGSLIQGNALSAAADNAAEFVSLAIQNTPAGQDTRFGVWFEPLLPRLCPPRDF